MRLWKHPHLRQPSTLSSLSGRGCRGDVPVVGVGVERAMVQVQDGVCAGAGGDHAAHQQHGEEEDEAVLRLPDHSHISGVGSQRSSNCALHDLYGV